MKTERQKKKEKVSVVPPTNAVVHPRAVMIECLETKSQSRKDFLSRSVPANVNKRMYLDAMIADAAM